MNEWIEDKWLSEEQGGMWKVKTGDRVTGCEALAGIEGGERSSKREWPL